MIFDVLSGSTHIGFIGEQPPAESFLRRRNGEPLAVGDVLRSCEGEYYTVISISPPASYEVQVVLLETVNSAFMTQGTIRQTR